MSTDLSGSLVGLSVLSNANAFSTYAPISSSSSSSSAIETKAVRVAKAQFTTPAVTPLWKQPTTDPSIAAVQAMSTIIDTSNSASLPADVQTDFTIYKALGRLNVLATAAAAIGTPDAQRKQLEASFARGMAQLQTYMASAPSNQLKLSFGQPSSTAKSIAIGTPPVLPAVVGNGVVSDRYAALPGITGTEKLDLTISQRSMTSKITLDLSTVPQPPTLDGIASAFNSQIAAIPQLNADGTTVTDASGNAVPRWNVSFGATKNNGSWGLTVKRSGLETISLDQQVAGDSLIVAANMTAPGSAVAAKVIRFDDPTGAMTKTTQGTIAAVDPVATALAQAAAAATPTPKSTTSSTKTTPAPITVGGATSASAVAVDSHGYSYIVGTAAGNLGSAQGNGSTDLFVSKRDSEGNVVWQQDLGTSATAQGASVSLASNGDVVVAGTVTGIYQGLKADGDMLVARFASNGDQKFATLVPSAGADTAKSVLAAPDGSIYVAGQIAQNGGSAFIVKLDSTGQIAQRNTIATNGASVNALALDAGGNLLALTQQASDSTLYRLDSANPGNVLGSFDLGNANARALAVSSDGTIAVGGATLAPVAGTPANTMVSGRDGFVTQIASDFSGAKSTYFATTGDDQVDSVAYMNGTLYAGGRTSGLLGSARQGTVDGFVGRIAPSTGAITSVDQFGQAGSQTGAVQIAAAPGDDTALGALGLSRGNITDAVSSKLVTETSLQPGDSFSIKVNDGMPIKITIGAKDTLASLSSRLSLLTGGAATVTTPKSGTGKALQIAAKTGNSVQLLAGPSGSDALSKLGIGAQTISIPKVNTSPDAPKVKPGARMGLGLSTTTMSIATAAGATAAVSAFSKAMSVTQTGFRSLYWDSTKAAMANAGAGGSSSNSAAVAALNAQTSQYQAALDRLTGGTTTQTTTDPILGLYANSIISSDSSTNGSTTSADNMTTAMNGLMKLI